jgi:hypothetical protein
LLPAITPEISAEITPETRLQPGRNRLSRIAASLVFLAQKAWSRHEPPQICFDLITNAATQ